MDRVPNEVTDVTALSTSDALRRLAKGPDDRAWTTVLNRHGVDILRATRRILGDPMSAEDACQETLLQIRDRAGQFRGRPGAPDATARNWIMRIACNTALHMLRQRKRAKLRELKVSREMPQITELDSLETNGGEHGLAEKVRAEMAELPDRQRVPLMLHFYAGLDYEQLSSELQCGVGAARVRVHRALEKLRQRMAVMGILVTTAAIYTILSVSSSTASAAEAVLDPERFGRWRELLTSSQHAAINVVSDPHFHLLGKVGYAAASAAVCGALALTFSRPAPQKAAMPATEIRKPVAAMTPPKEPATRNAQPVSALPLPVAPIAEIKPVELAVPAMPVQMEPAGSVSPRGVAPASVPAPDADIASVTPPAPQNPLVSQAAELEMLQTMQHDLNQRVARVHFEIETRRALGGTITPADHARLQRAAEDQADLANLIRKIADEMRYAKPAESSHAGLH